MYMHEAVSWFQVECQLHLLLRPLDVQIQLIKQSVKPIFKGVDLAPS